MNELTPDEHKILVDAIHDSATVVHKGRMMNERIIELAEESYNEFYNIHIDLEQFAELIIRECAEVGDSVDPLQDGGIARMIKQHFGIE